VNVVIPMAGMGSRLANDPSRRPKPLIEVQDLPLWLWAVRCLPLDSASRIVFVCLRQHAEKFNLETEIPNRLDERTVRVVVLDEVTDGQLRTVVMAQNELALDEPLLVFNADSWFHHSANDFLRMADLCDGVLGVASKAGDKWSFARVDQSGRVVEVAEKRRISDHACTGLYYFRDTRKFLADANTMFNEGETTNGEYFVAPLYQRMIARGERIGVTVADEFRPIGTPEELADFRSFISTDSFQTRS